MMIAWILFGAFCVAFVALVAMTSAAIRLASRLNDAERNLRTSRQAHALDVQALTAKLLDARKAKEHAGE